MKKMRLMMVAAAAVLGVAAGSYADDVALQIQSGDTVKSVLERSVGQTVGVRVAAGDEIRGKVTKVGDKVVHLSELSGKEFYDAVVPLDSISAVIVKARSK
jgi:hypothetical protein